MKRGGKSQFHKSVWAAVADALVDAGLNIHLVFVLVSYDQQDDDHVRHGPLLLPCKNAGNFFSVIEDELYTSVIRGILSHLHVGAGISHHFLLFCLAAGVPALVVWQNPYYIHKPSGLMSPKGS